MFRFDLTQEKAVSLSQKAIYQRIGSSPGEEWLEILNFLFAVNHIHKNGWKNITKDDHVKKFDCLFLHQKGLIGYQNESKLMLIFLKFNVIFLFFIDRVSF